MREAYWHTYQVLTKRHERMHALLSGDLRWLASLPNVWFGASFNQYLQYRDDSELGPNMVQMVKEMWEQRQR